METAIGAEVRKIVKVIAPIMIVCLSLMISCAPKQADDDQLKKIVLPVGYIPNVQFAPFYVAIANGYYENEGFDVELQYGYEIDGVSLVGTGEYDFTVASGEQVLLAREKGLPVVYVMNWYQDFPVGISVLEGSGIDNLADLRDKKIGIPALQGASYIAYRGLMDVAGLEDGDVNLEVIGFTQAELLMSGNVEAVVVYVANTPVQLKAQGIETTTFAVSESISLIGNGIVVNETLAMLDPDSIEGFIRATLKGIEFAANEPEKTYEICESFVENLENETSGIQYQVLEASIPFWNTDDNGFSSKDGWETMANLLIKMDLISSELILAPAYSNGYLP